MDETAQHYFQAIERHFVERRGRALLLSPEDVRRVDAWHRAGIPLAAVVEGIDMHFDRMARRGREPRRAVTLAYCEDDVHDAWAAEKQRRLGLARKDAAAAATAAGPADHARFVDSLDKAAARLAETGPPALAAAVAKAAAKLREKAGLFDPAAADHDDQRTEEHLRRLEKSLLAAAREAAGPEGLAAVEASVDASLDGKREAMKAETLERVRTQLVDKRLRERHGLPRLSIFYT